MILSRAPTRITLGGGGTDLESYYSKHGGFLIAAAINRYCSVLASTRFYDSIRLSYSETEIVNKVSDIKHRIFRAALEYCGIDKGIELHSAADVPANSGLGSSSSFTVALLNALHAYKKEFVSRKQLAEEACHLEIDVLGEPIGKQDQYIAAFGGLTCLTFEPDGKVIVEPLRVSSQTLADLESDMLLFFTGKERKASDILCQQDKKSRGNDCQMLENLHHIKEIGLETRKCLESGKLRMLGELFHEHWETKKKRSDIMTDPFLDECYEFARKKGALGGKLVGAGGGGFFLFVCNGYDRIQLMEGMLSMGLRWERFHFDFDGAKILVNI